MMFILEREREWVIRDRNRKCDFSKYNLLHSFNTGDESTLYFQKYNYIKYLNFLNGNEQM